MSLRPSDMKRPPLPTDNPIPETFFLTNKELSEAIVRTKNLIYSTSPGLDIFKMLTEHMECLLIAEKLRAHMEDDSSTS